MAFFALASLSTFGQTCGIMTTVAGNGTGGFAGDGGPATAAELYRPSSMAVDAAGNVYIADLNNHRIRVVTSTGMILTLVGNGTPGYSGDGSAATAAKISGPTGVAVDAAGNVYIADQSNRRVRKVDGAGIITTFAGNGTAGHGGDGGPATAAELYMPYGLALDSGGNLYISDWGSNVVRKVNTAGIISTVAGNDTAGYAGDGGAATAAELHSPGGLAIDTSGNLYIAEYANFRVRKVNAMGVISTFAGTGTAGFSGDGGPATAAQLTGLTGVAVDASQNVYISDTGNRIRKIDASGTITTFAGNGLAGEAGDGGLATSAEIYYPCGVATDLFGDVYIADYGNNRIREVGACNTASPLANGVPTTSYAIFPNPGNGRFNISCNRGYGRAVHVVVSNCLGQVVYEGTLPLTDGRGAFDMAGAAHGVYFVEFREQDGVQSVLRVVLDGR
jgi:trimeric autotransporter adhesin